MMAGYITLFVPSPLRKSHPHQKYQSQIDGTIVLSTQVLKRFLLAECRCYIHPLLDHRFPLLATVGPPAKSNP